VSNCEIDIRNPYVNIELNRLWARIYVGSSKAESAGVFYQIDRVLKLRQRRFGFIYRQAFIWTLIAINASFAALTLGTKVKLPVDLRMTWNIFFVAAFSYISWVTLRKSAVIIAAKRSESVGFFVRNRDNLVVALIAAVVGAAIGIWGTNYFTGKENKGGGEGSSLTSPTARPAKEGGSTGKAETSPTLGKANPSGTPASSGT
jgi:hypothetical protein